MVRIIIKQKKRNQARKFVRHLEEEHPEVRGLIKIKNSRPKRSYKGKMSLKRQAQMVTKTKTSL